MSGSLRQRTKWLWRSNPSLTSLQSVRDRPLCFHRRLDRRTCADECLVLEYVRMRGKIEGNARRPVSDREEVSVCNREPLANEVLVVAQMLVQVRVACSKAASEHLLRFLRYALIEQRSERP